jgi:hypothetical protein
MRMDLPESIAHGSGKLSWNWSFYKRAFLCVRGRPRICISYDSSKEKNMMRFMLLDRCQVAAIVEEEGRNNS